MEQNLPNSSSYAHSLRMTPSLFIFFLARNVSKINSKTAPLNLSIKRIFHAFCSYDNNSYYLTTLACNTAKIYNLVEHKINFLVELATLICCFSYVTNFKLPFLRFNFSMD